eukprot:6007448-Pleurochrysis_carterae.AAC.1
MSRSRGARKSPAASATWRSLASSPSGVWWNSLWTLATQGQAVDQLKRHRKSVLLLSPGVGRKIITSRGKEAHVAAQMYGANAEPAFGTCRYRNTLVQPTGSLV